MNKLQNRNAGTPFRLLFLNLLWLPIILALAFFVTRQHGAGKPIPRTRPSEILQFTSSRHVLGFAPGGVYVASGSHALHVEFVNPLATSPVSDAAPGDDMPGNGATRGVVIAGYLPESLGRCHIDLRRAQWRGCSQHLSA